MTQPKSFAFPCSDLTPFLLAEIEYRPDGASPTVFSLLAVTGVDPWSEADRLASLPSEDAIAALAATIAASAVCASPRCDPAMTAARLLAHLPAQRHQRPQCASTALPRQYAQSTQERSFAQRMAPGRRPLFRS
jgi:hypothetical protein